MNPEELRGKLAGLHELLSQSPSMDGESRQLLHGAVQDIERLLDRPEAGTVPSLGQGNRLEELATRFEANHPAITGALLQLADLLGKAGI